MTLLMSSCKDDANKLTFFKVKEEQYTQFINNKKMPTSPNLNIDKVIYDSEYPVEIAIYNDGNFYYHLENLGSGTGTWTYEEGSIKLLAKRKIFFKVRDMIYKFTIIKEDGLEATLEFKDRFGVNQPRVEFKNL